MSDLYNLMYGKDDENETNIDEKSKTINDGKLSLTIGDLTKIEIDGKTVFVVTDKYIQKLEKRLSDSERKIKQISSSIKRIEHMINKHSNELKTIRNDLSNKIDMRDY